MDVLLCIELMMIRILLTLELENLNFHAGTIQIEVDSYTHARCIMETDILQYSTAKVSITIELGSVGALNL